MSDTHDCPGGCGDQLPFGQFACSTCRARLPESIRAQLAHAWLTSTYGSIEHNRAVRIATTWYRDNPRTAV